MKTIVILSLAIFLVQVECSLIKNKLLDRELLKEDEECPCDTCPKPEPPPCPCCKPEPPPCPCCKPEPPPCPCCKPEPPPCPCCKPEPPPCPCCKPDPPPCPTCEKPKPPPCPCCKPKPPPCPQCADAKDFYYMENWKNAPGLGNQFDTLYYQKLLQQEAETEEQQQTGAGTEDPAASQASDTVNKQEIPNPETTQPEDLTEANPPVEPETASAELPEEPKEEAKTQEVKPMIQIFDQFLNNIKVLSDHFSRASVNAEQIQKIHNDTNDLKAVESVFRGTDFGKKLETFKGSFQKIMTDIEDINKKFGALKNDTVIMQGKHEDLSKMLQHKESS